MCPYQEELRRIRQELEKALKQIIDLYISENRQLANAQRLSYLLGYRDALQRALQSISEPEENE